MQTTNGSYVDLRILRRQVLSSMSGPRPVPAWFSTANGGRS